MNLKYIVLFASIVTYFQSLFSQNKSTNLDIFKKNPTEIRSFDEGKREAEKIIRYLINNKLTPGVSVTVTKNGHTVWQEGYGKADIEHNTPINPTKTLFRIASVSKPISAVALAKMQELEYIDWHKSLYDYVPDFPRKPFDFTIKQLGGHLAGIRGYRGREMFSNKPLSIEEGVQMFARDPLEFAPGTRYSYNSFNWNLVSLAMQNAAEMPFENIVLDNVLTPLQMHQTFPDHGIQLPQQAVAYSSGKKGFSHATEVNNYYKLAGGGYLSTSDDIAKLGNAMLCHDFLPQAIQSEMLSMQCTDDERDTGYGIGWQVSRDWNGRHYYGHIGNGIGGYAWFYCYPQEQVVVVLLFNVTNPKIDLYIQRIIDFTLEASEYLDNSLY
ncbi:MAG: serine hydrolase domain-containing protein [Capnocytophaga sp.]|nr:serine hydrolase domain-containing protein [Capnocytophaga sp.]